MAVLAEANNKKNCFGMKQNILINENFSVQHSSCISKLSFYMCARKE